MAPRQHIKKWMDKYDNDKAKQNKIKVWYIDQDKYEIKYGFKAGDISREHCNIKINMYLYKIICMGMCQFTRSEMLINNWIEYNYLKNDVQASAFFFYTTSADKSNIEIDL